MAKKLKNVLKYIVKGNSCWVWSGQISNCGYGSFAWNEDGKTKGAPAHRVVYELLVGTIEEGLALDHLCRNRLCVNPSHLEPVSNRENLMRSNLTQAYKNSNKTECKNGHKLVKSNIYYRKDRFGRECKTCRTERGKLWHVL